MATSIQEDLQEYLAAKGIDVLLLELTENLVACKPGNPVRFIIDHLQLNYPDLCGDDFIGEFEDGVARFSESETDESEDEHDENFKRSTKISTRRRGAICGATSAAADRKTASSDAVNIVGRLLPQSRLLRWVDIDQLNLLPNVLGWTDVAPDTLVVEPGMSIPGPLLLASGTLLLREPSDAADSETPRPLDAKIEAPAILFEHTLFDAAAVAVDSMVADSPVMFAWLPREALLHTASDVGQREYSTALTAIARIPLLKELTPSERHQLIPAASVIDFSADDVIARQGDPSEAAFVVLSGRVLIGSQASPTQEFRLISTLQPGMVFNEMALLRRAPHRYSAIAAVATRCLAIGRRALERLLGPAKHILQRDEAFAAQFMALRM